MKPSSTNLIALHSATLAPAPATCNLIMFLECILYSTLDALRGILSTVLYDTIHNVSHVMMYILYYDKGYASKPPVSLRQRQSSTVQYKLSTVYSHWLLLACECASAQIEGVPLFSSKFKNRKVKCFKWVPTVCNTICNSWYSMLYGERTSPCNCYVVCTYSTIVVTA